MEENEHFKLKSYIYFYQYYTQYNKFILLNVDFMVSNSK